MAPRSEEELDQVLRGEMESPIGGFERPMLEGPRAPGSPNEADDSLDEILARDTAALQSSPRAPELGESPEAEGAPESADDILSRMVFDPGTDNNLSAYEAAEQIAGQLTPEEWETIQPAWQWWKRAEIQRHLTESFPQWGEGRHEAEERPVLARPPKPSEEAARKALEAQRGPPYGRILR